MEELSQAISDRANDKFEIDLTEVSIKWAAYCLKNHRGEMLNRGLAISKALCAYEDAFRPKQEA